MKRHAWLSVGFSLVAMGAAAQQQKVGDLPEASNMKLLGWSDLQARSAYQPTIHKQGERWIAAPRTDYRIKDRIRYSRGMEMGNFYSRALNRTFDSILFVESTARAE